MNNVDNSMDDMTYTRFITRYSGLIRHYAANTKLSYTDIACIFLVYHKFVIANGENAKYMSKIQFVNVFLTIFNMCDAQIVSGIMTSVSKNTNEVDPHAWMELISVFTSEDLELKIQFTFNVYSRSYGILNREAVAFAVENFFSGDDEDEINELRSEMVEFLFYKFDTDKDSVINFEEFAEVVREQPPLLEFLGKVFPEMIEMKICALCLGLVSFLERWGY